MIAPLSPAHERRGAARYSLLMKTAKLICQSGEYPCICRDVSASGVKIRLFHALPPEDFFLLELASGMRYPVALVWENEREAGLRFADAIDPTEFFGDKSVCARRSIRLRISASAVLTIGKRRQNARLVNLSQHGACIETAALLPERQRLTLSIEGIPLREAYVRWRRGFEHGLVLQQGFTLAELAAHALDLQPIPTDRPVLRHLA